ncbi:MAG: hypothetical protein MJB12_07645 [Firmicutes bacterium]|nr:hypothetical protein [Bacillota bacterium]
MNIVDFDRILSCKMPYSEHDKEVASLFGKVTRELALLLPASHNLLKIAHCNLTIYLNKNDASSSVQIAFGFKVDIYNKRLKG